MIKRLILKILSEFDENVHYQYWSRKIWQHSWEVAYLRSSRVDLDHNLSTFDDLNCLRFSIHQLLILPIFLITKSANNHYNKQLYEITNFVFHSIFWFRGKILYRSIYVIFLDFCIILQNLVFYMRVWNLLLSLDIQ